MRATVLRATGVVARGGFGLGRGGCRRHRRSLQRPPAVSTVARRTPDDVWSRWMRRLGDPVGVHVSSRGHAVAISVRNRDDVASRCRRAGHLGRPGRGVAGVLKQGRILRLRVLRPQEQAFTAESPDDALGGRGRRTGQSP
jgi:hypothetical protein